MNTHVNFELAKLLKEKNFNKRSGLYNYNNIGELTLLEGLNAPTITEVVMWLYEKHGIWIEVYYDNSKKEFYTVWDGEEYKFNSPTEAYEAAIEYTLKHSI